MLAVKIDVIKSFASTYMICVGKLISNSVKFYLENGLKVSLWKRERTGWRISLPLSLQTLPSFSHSSTLGRTLAECKLIVT